MKKRILLLPLLMLTLATSAQVASSCQTTYLDTLKYVDQLKTSSWAAIPVNVINDGGAYGYAGFGQRFEAPDSVKVLGFSFRGFVFSGASDTVVCRLYEGNGSGLPGVQIDSVIHTVPLVPGFTSPLDAAAIMNTVMFGSGHVLEGDYIVTVENFSTSDMYIVRNNDGDGAGEDLSLTYYRGLSDPSFDAWYSTFSFGAGWNFDMPFEPIIEYSFDSELTISADSICGSDTLIVFDAIVSFDDSVLYNKMYNPNYATYMGHTPSVNYDYGDGMSDGTGVHMYNGSGSFVVSASDTILASGWTNNSFVWACSDVVFVEAQPDAGTAGTLTVCQGTTPTDAELFAELNGTPTAGGTWANVGLTYTYTVSATAPCTTPATADVVVTEEAQPNAGTAGALTVCQGTTPTDAELFAELNGTPTAGGTWANVGLTYTYTVSATAPCTTPATADVVVTEQAASLGSDTTICMQSSMIISPGVFDTYSWNTGQLTDSIIVGPILNPGVITYTVDVTSVLCNSTASITITFNNCIGIEEIKNHSLNAYPNPANDNFTITTDFTQNYELKIYDNQGKIVMVYEMLGTVKNIDVSVLEQGVYILTISDGNQVVRKKLQILR